MVQETNKRLDEVREAEAKEKKLLKGHRFTFICERTFLKRIYKNFILNAATNKVEDAWENFLKWMNMVEQTALEPFKKLVTTFKGYLFGIKTFFEEGNVTNGSLESLSSKVQLAKRRARGYSNVSNFMDMAYYINGRDASATHTNQH